jgi:large subunit ribosomal protein L18e
MRIETKNKELKKIIDLLYTTSKQKNKDVYYAVAKELEKSNKNKAKVNLVKINNLKNIVDTSIVVVPGKVLGYGDTTKKPVVYAQSFSKTAKDKLKNNAKTLVDFCNDKINYKNIVIIK